MPPLSDFWPRHSNLAKPGKTAFVLSGGAAMGALQVGMLRALLERRIHPDLIVGCSVGAMNGAVLAEDPSLATVGRMQDIWMDLVDRNLLPMGLLPSTVQLVRKGASITSNESIAELINEVIGSRTFAELTVPFECVATNIQNATEHWFHEGNLQQAVLASASIPALFPPVEIDGTRFVDGGVVDDVPVQRAVELGATRIFVLQVGGVDRPRPDPRRPLDMAVLAYWIARRHRFLDDLARIPEDVEVIILPHGNPRPVRYNDLSRSAQLMDVAYRASVEHIDARADGRIPPMFGPMDTSGMHGVVLDEDHDENAELEAAHRLYIAAQEAVDIVAEPNEHRSRLSERAEAIGPAMRALVDRFRDRDGSPTVRRVPFDDEFDDEN